MKETRFQDLPSAIQAQISTLLNDSGLSQDEESRNRMASIWQQKFELFNSQTASLGMESVSKLDRNDPRGAILLSYSGSLISLGPLRGKSRWLEYASIKLRTDVPDLIRGDRITVAEDLKVDSAAQFNSCPIKRSSAIYRITVCPEGISVDDQERRIREATIFLTNGFVKLNRSRVIETSDEVDQFTTKAIISYIAKKNGVTQLAARGLIEDFLSMVETGMILGERVSVGKLGSASLRYQAARKARMTKNLKTGEDLLIPAKAACLAPKFSFSQAVKDKCAAVDPTLLGGEEDEDE